MNRFPHGRKAPKGFAQDRAQWRRRRIEMENHKQKHTPFGGPRTRYWALFKALIGLFGLALRLAGLYERGVRNALDIRTTYLELQFEDLPQEFDGFRILQLSDLHVDYLPEVVQIGLGLASKAEVDICVLTGDYRESVRGAFDHILPEMRSLVARVDAKCGVWAILGNHDCADMVEAFESLGITMLVNETLSLRRGDSEIHIAGTDDVHYFYTTAARDVLDQTPGGFKIALVHSAELADVAADSGFHLYLAGHTHGGQVCLPGGLPILTHLSRFRRYASGLWRHRSMTGYTSTGVGVSGLPVRFFSRGEIVFVTLRTRKKGS